MNIIRSLKLVGYDFCNTKIVLFNLHYSVYLDTFIDFKIILVPETPTQNCTQDQLLLYLRQFITQPSSPNNVVLYPSVNITFEDPMQKDFFKIIPPHKKKTKKLFLSKTEICL